MKKNLFWILTTFILYILLATVTMYSRESTLNGVRILDFKILIETIKNLDEKNLDKKFEDIANILTFGDGQQVLFPLALLGENSCVDNSSQVGLICGKYSNANELNSKIEEIKNTIKPRIYNDRNIYNIEGNDYVYEIFSDGKILIGKTGAYLGNGNIVPMYNFFKNKWINYFLSWNGDINEYDGFKLTWKKTNGMFIIIFLVSFLLWILHKIQFKKYNLQYQTLKKQEIELNDNLNALDDKYNDLKLERYESEQVLIKLELELSNMESKSAEEIEALNNTIAQQKHEHDELDKLVEDEEDYIEKLERERIELHKTINMQLSKLEEDVQKEQNKLTFERLSKLELLWRYDPTWKERKEIESSASLKATHLPFTITLAFIAFENLVSKLAEPYNKNLEKRDISLDVNIKLIFENERLPLKYNNDFHDTKRARNRWFHAGVYPQNSIINFLVPTLDEVEADVFI